VHRLFLLRVAIMGVLLAGTLTGCSQESQQGAAAHNGPGDSVQKEMKELVRPEPVPDWAVDHWGDFDPIPTPGPNDWLAVHRETGQSFESFVRSHPNRPDEVRSTLVLQPIGGFVGEGVPGPEILRRFTEAFFGMEAQVFSAIDHRPRTYNESGSAGGRDELEKTHALSTSI
jgi:hypothetical protein